MCAASAALPLCFSDATRLGSNAPCCSAHDSSTHRSMYLAHWVRQRRFPEH